MTFSNKDGRVYEGKIPGGSWILSFFQLIGVNPAIKFLSLTPEQQKAFSFFQRTYPSHLRPVEVLKNEKLIEKVSAEIKKLEEREIDGFNKYIARLMARQLPQPQTVNWE